MEIDVPGSSQGHTRTRRHLSNTLNISASYRCRSHTRYAIRQVNPTSPVRESAATNHPRLRNIALERAIFGEAFSDPDLDGLLILNPVLDFAPVPRTRARYATRGLTHRK